MWELLGFGIGGLKVSKKIIPEKSPGAGLVTHWRPSSVGRVRLGWWTLVMLELVGGETRGRCRTFSSSLSSERE